MSDTNQTFRREPGYSSADRHRAADAECDHDGIHGGSMAHVERSNPGESFEEELYVEIVRAWFRGCSPRERRARPLRRHILSPGFPGSVAALPGYVRRERVMSVCARIACRYPVGLDGSKPVGLAQDRPPLDAGDRTRGVSAPVDLSREVRLLYWVLGNGTIEFDAVTLGESGGGR
jgi:hypothetical protein